MDDTNSLYDLLPDDYYDEYYNGPIYDLEDLQAFADDLNSEEDDTPNDGYVFGEDD